MWRAKQAAYAPHVRDIVSSLGIPRFNSRLSTSTHLCFGNKGSLRVSISGSTTGLYYDFENGEGGTIIDLIKQYQKTDHRSAFKFADSFVGKTSVPQGLQLLRGYEVHFEGNSPSVHVNINHNSLYSNSTPLSHALFSSSTNVDSSHDNNNHSNHNNHPGLTYLQDVRKIDLHRIRMSEDIRYVRPHVITGQDCPGIYACARNWEGTLTGGQITYLNNYGMKAKNQEIQKKSLGNIKGSYVCLQEALEENDTVFIAEGVETGLSVACAFPEYSVFAGLGQFNFSSFGDFTKKTSTSISQIIVCADHDSTPSKLVNGSVRDMEKFFDVQIAKPTQVGFDFNDVLQTGGIEQIQYTIGEHLR